MDRPAKVMAADVKTGEALTVNGKKLALQADCILPKTFRIAGAPASSISCHMAKNRNHLIGWELLKFWCFAASGSSWTR